MKSVVGTGLSGLVGSKVVEILSDYHFDNMDLSHPVHPTDITQLDQVMKTVEASEAEVLLHFAAFTDVSKSWEQRGDKTGVAYKVNVVGTENMVKAAAATGKHLIHISTAYVFDGEKDTPYTEDDNPNPIEWYGQTKAWAEEAVQESTGSWTILRIDQPFRSDPFAKPDVVHKMIARMLTNELPPQFTNHWIGPTYIDDFVKVMKWVIDSKPQGIYHATSGEQWTDYDLAAAVQETLQLPGEIKKGDLNEYLKQSQRPYQRNTALNTTKLRQEYPGQQLSIREALRQVTFERDASH